MTIALLTEKLRTLVEPLASSLGLGVWGIEIAIGAKGIVRVYVEGADGVDIESCAELSRMLGLSLDVEELISVPYTLEVSSPGLGRIFFTAAQVEQYAGATDSYMELWLHEPVAAYPNRRKFIGRLAEAHNGVFTLHPTEAPGPGLEICPITFAWGDVKKIRLSHYTPEPAGKGPASKGKKKGRKPVEKKMPGMPTPDGASTSDLGGTQ